MDGFKYEQRGYCPCCERPTVFSSEDPWFRDHLLCASCSSLVRERALALIISETIPNWRDLAIHESSPGNCYLSAKMKREALGYIGTHYFPDEELGKEVRGFRNENLEAQTFLGGSFDLVLTLDVMEHVFDPAAVYREIYRIPCGPADIIFIRSRLGSGKSMPPSAEQNWPPIQMCGIWLSHPSITVTRSMLLVRS